MSCLCCGRAVTEGHAFCAECQTRMDKYPVKPGTAIHLPHRNAPVVTKKRTRRKKQISQEEQILLLRKVLRQTRVFLVLATIIMCLAVGMLVYQTSQNGIQQHYQTFHPDDNIGRNYTIDTTQGTD